MDPTPYFTAIGCNRDGRCLKWDHSTNLVAYAGSNVVAVYNTDKSVNIVIATMRGHTQDISTLGFFPQSALTQYAQQDRKATGSPDLLISKVVSGCFGGKVCIFDLYQAHTTQYRPTALNASIKPSDSGIEKNHGKFFSKLNSTITLPNTAILHAEVITVHNFVLLVVVTSTGGIHLYGQDITAPRPEDQSSPWVHLQDIYVPTNQLIQTTAFSIYPHPDEPVLLLALGGVDGTLTILATTAPFVWTVSTDLINVKTAPQPLFALLGSLKSHRDWIRDIAFSPVQYDPNTDQLTKVLLATASQDKTIRILSIHVPPKIVLSATKTASSSSTSSSSSSSSPEDSDQESELTAHLLQSSSLGENGHLWSVLPSTNNILQTDPKPIYIAVSLETVLFGHENWVMSLEFFEQGADKDFKLNLLSVSTDRTIVEWVQQSYRSDIIASSTHHSSDNGSNSLWVPVDKIGEGLGYLCYYGGCYGPHSNSVIAVAYNGSLSMWDRFNGAAFVHDDDIPRQAIGPSGIVKPWYPVHCPTGHNKPVLDVMISTGDDTTSANFMSTLKSRTAITTDNWSGPQLPYILTLSQDQTTRAYAPFVTDKTPFSALNPEQQEEHQCPPPSQLAHLRPTMVRYPWYELARAQIHGWDLCALTHVNLTTTGASHTQVHHHEFFSAGEEKVLRLFRAPALFVVQLYAMTSDIEYTTEQYQALISLLVETPPAAATTTTTTAPSPFPSTHIVRPLCAVQPKLGLSNKPLLLGDELATGTELEANFGDGAQSQLLTVEMLLDSLPTMTTITTTTTIQQQRQSLIAPPYEEQLATTTLWSEVDKLYGHGYDISTLTATQPLSTQPYQPTLNHTTFQSPQIFSVNHARKAKNAGIRQWAMASGDLFGGDNGNEYWEESDVLNAHQQTISTMKPTLDNHYLLTVGRDMQVTVFGCGNHAELESAQALSAALATTSDGSDASKPSKVDFKPVAVQAAAHSRQIFNCSWIFDTVLSTNEPTTPTLKYFTTCARDKTIKVWAFNPAAQAAGTKPITLIQTLKTPHVPAALHAVLVLDQIPTPGSPIDPTQTRSCTSYLFVGFESGDMAVYTATLPVTLVPVTHQYDHTDILPYSIIMASPDQNPISFVPLTTFDPTIAHNAAVNQIVTFPKTIVNSAAEGSGQVRTTHLYEKNDHLVIVTASNDHSVKMFGVDL